ncbi:MAG: asparagine synthase (glutamine-hydrolyzing) [Thermoanaerobaculales bacterium]|nr:asparagine synthase (glutamine-hydrolyzing) [Thermoanaerobaculales bacterium]
MCGICGWVDWRGRTEEGPVRRMAEALVHRGPDGEGYWRDPNGVAVLGHRRLAVLDLSDNARQPMIDPSGSVLVFNGEVYGFREIRSRLEAEGRVFRSSGDAEVVLAALSRWGRAAVDAFDGQFVLAFWDAKRRRLLLVRDRLGIKPLFWAETEGGLIFASELPALLRHPGVRRDLAAEEVSNWLQLGYGAGTSTLVRGVQRLAPGHCLEMDEDGLRIRRWYDVLEASERGDGDAKTIDEAAESLEGLLRHSVRRRLVSDVPLGCFLSGGVDSAAVVGAAVAEGARPDTLTIRFSGGRDESDAAARVAATFGLAHRVGDCEASHLERTLAGWARATGDPLADPSFLPTGLVSAEARKNWTVALSGDGGDELLSGYPRLRAMPRLERILGAPRVLRKAPGLLLPAERWANKLRAALAAPDRWSAYQALQGVWPLAEVASLMNRTDVGLPWGAIDLKRLESLPSWTRWRALDVLTFLPERMLAKVDRASMAASLEVRVPLLDHHIVEFLLSLPSSPARDKGVLRRTLDRLRVPQPSRRKVGFEIPLGSWLRGPLREPVRALVFGEACDDLGLDRKILEKIWLAHQSGAADYGERLLAVAVLSRWLGDVLG